MARACVFCGVLKQSKEHVYPKWLRKLVGTHDKVITITETERAGGAKRELTNSIGRPSSYVSSTFRSYQPPSEIQSRSPAIRTTPPHSAGPFSAQSRLQRCRTHSLVPF